MATKSSDDKKITGIQRRNKLTELWQQPATDWKAFLEKYEFENVSAAGDRVKLCCPYHDDRSPSSTIDIRRGFFRCYSSKCNAYEWDPIKFLSSPAHRKQRFKSYGEAFLTFKKEFNANAPRALVKEFEEGEKYRNAMRLLAELCRERLDLAWSSMTNEESAQATVDYLKNRGISEALQHASLGMWPSLSEVRTYFTNHNSEELLEYLPEKINKAFTTTYQNWVTFIYATDVATPSSFKIREPQASTTDPGQKRIYTLAKENYLPGALGLLNAGYGSLLAKEAKDSHVYAMEGDFDALLMYEHQLKTGAPNAVYVALGGAGHSGVDFMRTSGVGKVYIVGDDDEKDLFEADPDELSGGQGFIKSVLDKTKDMATAAFVWPTSIKDPNNNKMDPDNAIKMHGFPSVEKEVLDRTNYVHPHLWAVEQADLRMSQIPIDDVRALTEEATRWSTLLHDPVEKNRFMGHITRTYKLLEADIRRVESDASDSFETFVNNIANALQNRYYPHYYDRESNTLSLWDRTKTFAHSINVLRDDSIESLYMELPYSSVYGWVRDVVGVPSFLPPLEGEDAVPSKQRYVYGIIGDAFKQAVQQLAYVAPDKPARLLGQGVHLRDVEKTGRGYIVSGSNMYRLQYDLSSRTLDDVIKLPGPNDGAHAVMRVDPRQISTFGNWFEQLTNGKNFLRKPKYTAAETLEKVHAIINKHWRFRYQGPDAQFFALYVPYTYILGAWDRRLMVHLTGEAETGKSSLMSLVAGGNQLKEFKLTYNAHTVVKSTLAGFEQTYADCCMVAGHDELSDYGDNTPSSKYTQALYDRTRELAVNGRVETVRGSVNGAPVVRTMYGAMFTASDTQLRNPMDFSRYRTSNMLRDRNIGSIRARLSTEYPPEFWGELRHSIVYHVFTNLLDIKRRAEDLAKKYMTLEGLPKGLGDRFTETLYPLVAIGESFKWDMNDFLYKYCESRVSEERAAKENTRGNDLVHALLSMPKFPTGDTGLEEASLKTLLRNPRLHSAIDAIEGVYYDSETKWLCVDWHYVSGYMRRFGNEYSAAKMAYAATSSPKLVDISRARSSGSLTKFKQSGLTGRRYHIFDISDEIVSAGVPFAEAQQPSNANLAVVIDTDDDIATFDEVTEDFT